MTTIHERVEYIAKNLAKSRTNLARRTGYAQKQVDRYAKGETKDVPVDFISAVVREFPKISLRWLVMGIGEPLREADHSTNQASTMRDMEERIRELKYTVELQKQLLDAQTGDFLNTTAAGAGNAALLSRQETD
jgi:hypothetical protein